jgi:aspartokinase/homoserine dehydrogenase 1
MLELEAVPVESLVPQPLRATPSSQGAGQPGGRAAVVRGRRGAGVGATSPALAAVSTHPPEYMARLPEFDADMDAKLREAEASGEVLR